MNESTQCADTNIPSFNHKGNGGKEEAKIPYPKAELGQETSELVQLRHKLLQKQMLRRNELRQSLDSRIQLD